ATDWAAKAGGAANDRSMAARSVGDLRIMRRSSAPSKAAGFMNVGPAALPTALESKGNLGGDEGAEPNEWVDATRSTGQRLPRHFEHRLASLAGDRLDSAASQRRA